MLPLRLPLRLAARVGRTPSRLVRRSIAPSPSSRLSLARVSVSRSYATVGRPRKDASASEKPKRSTTSTGSDATKPAAAKKPVKKAAKKPVKKPAKKPAKKAARKPVKKVSNKTPEQLQAAKERAAVKAQRLELKALKDKALSPPPLNKVRTFIIFHGDRARGIKRPQGESISQLVKDSAEAYGKLTYQELEHWNHIANQRNQQLEDEYNAFVQSHTADQIRIANIARCRLRQLNPKTTKKYAPLRDDRLVKRPTSAYLHYCTERLRSGDFRGVPVGQAMKDVSAEWKGLSSSEQQPYRDSFAKDAERYAKEHLEVYGYEPPKRSPSSDAE